MRLIKEVVQGIQNLTQTKQEIQRFAAVISAALVVLAALVFYMANDPLTTLWITGLNIILILIAIFVPQYLRYPYLVWMGLAFFLGGIVSRVILTIFYYIILTPIGLILRALGKNPVPRVFKQTAESYWIKKNKTQPARESYNRPF